MTFTGNEFLNRLSEHHQKVLPYFEVNTSTRKHHFWERKALPIELYSRKVIEQKLAYIHNNPLQEKWQLAKEPADYYYSSAAFYEYGKDDFGMITHVLDRI